MNHSATRKKNIERAHARVNCNIPTRFWLPQAERYFDLRIKNFSMGGVYVESSRRLRPDTTIDIFMGYTVFSPELLEDAKQYKVQIKWNDENRKTPPFPAGAQILSRCDTIEEKHVRELSSTCDMCGHRSVHRQVCEADACIFVCQACYNELPEGIRKYLQGNIY